jgi:enoyl-CoA hydratase/carnithine racemase
MNNDGRLSQSGHDHDIRVERDGPVLTVVLDRPASSNALTIEMLVQLWRVFDAFEHDDSVHVAVLTGAGDRVFCAGRDIDELRAPGAEDAAEIARNRPAGAPEDWLTRLLPEVSKVVVAAINGHAVGGGWALAQRCDLRVASEAAQFWLPEVTFGMGAGNFLIDLVRAAPASVVMEVAQLGYRLPASRLYELGLVNRVVAPADVVSTAQQLARQLAKHPQPAVRANKLVIQRATSPARDQLWEFADSVFEPLRRDRAADIVDRRTESDS